jgi:hypothetical protein
LENSEEVVSISNLFANSMFAVVFLYFYHVTSICYSCVQEDDLSTMEADEALITEDERKEELLALERESSLPIEEILKMYSSRRG